MGLVWESMGFFRWPMSLCFAVSVILGLWAALRLFRSGASPDLRTRAWLDGVPVWGFLAFLTGILSAVAAIIITLQNIEAAGAILPTVLAPGAKTVLISTGVGTMTLAFALVLWFILQLRWRFLEAAAGDARP